ncbi:glycosyltransferase-like protein gnt13 [Ruditapes philippinarum]|uniref:glycosyltransferase-like protein gnt13 n=1 Tax=Ruditapes philippinarum TaxID=129788 RepID=UPI00295A78B5|nr:glycosyltransferase-like protein gnt13 [Ruditapes philippinarum]
MYEVEFKLPKENTSNKEWVNVTDIATLPPECEKKIRRNHKQHYYIQKKSPTNDLFRIGQNAEYGDHITLQAITNIYNAQILVVSTLNSRTTLIIPNGLPDGEVNENLPMIVLGHYPEGEGEHYVALSYDKKIVRNIIYESEQIYFVETNSDHDSNNDTDNLPSDIDTANDNLDINDTENLPSDIDTANGNLDNNDTENLSIDIDTANDNLDNNDTENLPSDIDTANGNLDNNDMENLSSDIDTSNDNNLDNNDTENLPSDIDTANNSVSVTANDLNNDDISLRSLVENMRRRRRPIAPSY